MNKDPEGDICIPCAAAIAWAVVEVASAAYDAYDAYTTVRDPNASTAQKVTAVAGVAADIALPGGGYGKGAKTVMGAADKAKDSAKAADKVKTFGGKQSTVSTTSKEAFGKAKEANGIPRSKQPDITIKSNTPEGKKAGLDSRNVKQYEFTNAKGEKVIIRQDKAATYPDGGKQDRHYNSGNAKDDKLKQHHYYENPK